MAVMAPVLLPLVVVFSPMLHLDVDPRHVSADALSPISFGPTGIMWLAAASILISASVLAVTVWAGGRIRWWSCLGVAAGIVPCCWHLSDHFTSRLHAGTWLAAACLGLATLHLAQFQRPRRICIAALIAVALPLAMQSAWYVYVEHPDTVQSFQDNLEQSLSARGLSADSPEAAKYRTRLEGNDAIGAVGMSNVQGSVVASLLILTLVTALFAWRNRAGWLRVACAVGIVLMGAWTLKLTQSKGAVMALLAVLGLGIMLWLVRRSSRKLSHLAPWLCLLVVVAGSGAVLLRGVAGPPDDHLGERSLLFRFHYWQGATGMLADSPSDLVLGVGPGPFKDRYEQTRNPISPEIVSSTHNVFVDYAVMLGLGGFAWGLLLLGWLWRTGNAWLTPTQQAAESDRAPPTDPADDRPADKPLYIIGLLAAVVFLTQYAVEFPGLYAQTAILWLFSAAGYVVIAVYVVLPILQRSERSIPVAISLPATLLLLHAQIEMTFFWISAASFGWVMIALAAGTASNKQTQNSPTRAARDYMPAGVLLILALVFAVLYAEPATRHQQHLDRASQALRLSTNPAAAIAELDAAAAIIGNDPVTTRWRVGLRRESAEVLTQIGRPDEARVMLDQAHTVLDEAQQAGLGELTTARLRGNLTYRAYQITGDRALLKQAEQAYARAAELGPNSLNSYVRLADTRWELADFDAAAEAYRKALTISDNYYLDPETQLSAAERQRIEARLAGDSTQP